MKVYVTARCKGAENKHQVEALYKAVKGARLHDFSFSRDVEQKFASQKELWDRVRDEIGVCDMLLIDVSDHPTGGRMVEAGIAYAMRKPVIVVQKIGVTHKEVFDGIASKVITYKDYADLTQQLKQYDIDRNYNMTDKSTLLIMFLLVGGVIAWGLAQVHMLLAPVAVAVYWLIIRHFSQTMRAFDRVVIFIPLVLAWWAVFAWLNDTDILYGFAWTIAFWLLALALLRKMKLSL